MVEKWCRSVSYTRKRLSRSGGNKKIAKKDFYFFSNLPKPRVGGFEKLFIKKLWPKVGTSRIGFQISCNCCATMIRKVRNVRQYGWQIDLAVRDSPGLVFTRTKVTDSCHSS